MITPNKFQGFPKEGIKFLKDLKQNNNRDWFCENKQIFKDYLESPAKAFATQLSPKLSTLSGDMISEKIFRIYRDMRFSKDKTPYKTYLHISFLRESPRRGCGAHPSFYFSLEPGKLSIGLGIFEFAKDVLDTYQYAVIEDRAGKELEQIILDMNKKGFRLSEPEYKKIPLRFDSEPRANLLRHKGLSIWHDVKIPKEMSGHEAIDYCFKQYIEMMPLYRWIGNLEHF